MARLVSGAQTPAASWPNWIFPAPAPTDQSALRNGQVMKRLLLVEDDRSLGATLHERLLREPYDVAWVETKQRALKKLDEGLWDLIILDIGLPDGSGFELARHIKESTAV